MTSTRHVPRLLAAVIAATVVASACGAGAGSSSDTVTVRLGLYEYRNEDFTTAAGEQVEGFGRLIERFEAEHPEIDVEIIEIPLDSAVAKAQTLLLSNGIDVLNTGTYDFYRQGLIASLTDRVVEAGLEDDYYDGAFRAPTRTWDPADDEIIALPGKLDSATIAYDRQLFEDFAVEPLSDEPTMGEIVDKAAQLTGTNPRTGQQNYGVWIDGTWQTFLLMNYFLDADEQPVATPQYPTSYAAAETQWDTPEIAAAIEAQIDLLRTSAPPGFVSGKGSEAWGTENNDVAIRLYVRPGDMLPAAQNGLTERFQLTKGIRYEDDLGYFQQNLGWFIAKNAGDADAAWTLATYLSGPEGQRFAYEQYGDLPSTKDTSFVDDAYSQTFIELSQAGALNYDYAIPFMVAEFRPALNDVVTRGVQGENVDVPGLLADVQENYESWRQGN